MAIAAGIQTRFLGAIKVGRLYLRHKIALTALALGGQTGATQIATILNRFDTVANANDSAMLPPCDPSRGPVIVINNTGTNMTLFTHEASGVNIGLVGGAVTAGSTGVTLGARKTYLFFATENNWYGGSLAA